MPSRWFVPIPGIDAVRVKLEFVHAAFSGWFDRSSQEHAAKDKPYTVSPLTDYRGRIGVEIATMTDDAELRLWQGIESADPVRLGNQIRRVGRATRLHAQSWEALEEDREEGQWTLEFVTPTTFRSGNRSTPLPSVAPILSGLSRSWDLWSGRASRGYDPRVDSDIWVTDLDLKSTVIRLHIGDKHGGNGLITLSASLGSLSLRCDDRATAARLAPLIRLAAYAGVGSMRGKGLGVTRVSTHGSRRSAPDLSSTRPGSARAAAGTSHGSIG